MRTHVPPRELVVEPAGASGRPAITLQSRIGRTYHFESAHHLPLVPDGHKCKNMHGHNYRVDIVIRGEPDSRGFIKDFAEIDELVLPLVRQVDHRVLNHVDGLENPTAENIAAWFFQRIPGCEKVRVYENHNCWAETSEPGHANAIPGKEMTVEPSSNLPASTKRTKLQSLAEAMRPQHLCDLTQLRQPIIDRLQCMIDEKSFKNMLFYGGTGRGKTSLAGILGKSVAERVAEAEEAATFLVRPSEMDSKDFERNMIPQIVSFAGEPPSDPALRQKLCIIDDADYLSERAQAMLLHPIDYKSKTCGFIFTANDISKIIPTLRSRLMEVCFDIAFADWDEVQERTVAGYEAKLTEVGMPYDQQRVREIVGEHFPDFRSITKHLDWYLRGEASAG